MAPTGRSRAGGGTTGRGQAAGIGQRCDVAVRLSGYGAEAVRGCDDRVMTAAHGAHDYVDDPRNAEILVSVNGTLMPRAQAMVSVFDAGFVLGDGVWEGLRVVDGHPAFLEQHLDRLWQGAAAIALDIGLSREQLTVQLYRTLAANAMTGEGVHIRLMVTRGPKSTPYQDPRMSAGPATVVIIAEHKDPLPSTLERGLSLFTVHVRRAGPDTLDPKLNAHSKLNDIMACIQAYTAGADEALMLDPHGFVATCNSTHFFIVCKGEVWTSTGMYCLGGITRSGVLRVCAQAGITAYERSFSLTDVYSADEAFVTGTYAGLVPVHTVDGRRIGRGERGPMVQRLTSLYRELVRDDVAGRAAP
jgi:branched-chain amino acid aminotransferase